MATTWPGEHVYDGVTWCAQFPADILDKVKAFDYADDDIIVATYPKSGTTWVQNILLKVKEANQPEAQKASEDEIVNSVFFKVIFLESKPPGGIDVPIPIDLLSQMPPGRLMRTHVQQHFFDEALKNRNTKFIICMRNIKDTLVSFYHFVKSNKNFGPYTGSWDEFFELYKTGRLVSGDPIDYNLGWWKLRHNQNILFLTYENLQQDHEKGVGLIAEHIGENLTDEQVKRVVEETTFGAMKKSLNPLMLKSGTFVKKEDVFFRKGAVGDWKNYFSKEQEAYVDKRIEEKLGGTGLSFIEEL